MHKYLGDDHIRLCVHFLDLPIFNLHTIDHIGKECNHVIIAHGHISNDLLESHLLGSMVLVLLDSIAELLAEFCNFALSRDDQLD